MDGQGSTSDSIQVDASSSEILLEGKLLKLSRSKVWQERHFVFSSNHTLSYSHKRETYLEPSVCYRITRDAGCEISDLYVEQRIKGTKKESLYCITLTWTETQVDFNESVNDFGSNHFGNDSMFLVEPLSPTLTDTPNKHDRRSSGGGGARFEESSVGGSQSDKSSIVFPFKPTKKTKGKLRLRRKTERKTTDNGDDDSAMSTGTPRSPTRISKKTKYPASDNVPSFVNMDIDQNNFPEYETIAETSENEKSPTRRPRPIMRSSSKDSPDKMADGKNRFSSYEERNASEQEKLHDQFLDKEKRKSQEYQKKLYKGAKIATATGAALGVGVLTAGVGLAAGFAVLGAAAAAGGTAGVIEVGSKKLTKKSGKLTVATTKFEEAKLWKASLDACLESESMKTSTWAQKYVEEGRRTSLALLPHDVELRARHAELMTALKSPREVDGGINTSRHLNLPAGQKNLFLRNRNLLAETGAKWLPLEGGWTSILGPGAQSLRVYQEETIEMEQKSKRTSRLGIGGSSTSGPVRSQVTLNAHPLDAFMCLMSYGRIDSRDAKDDLTPKSGQIASYRLLEKIDDHTDIVHLFFRNLYLFPSWTEPRDFVLFRYWRYEPDGSYFVCYESVEHPVCPPQPGYVRGEMHQVCTLAPTKKMVGQTGRKECMLTTVVQVDPRGWIPTKPIPFLSNQSYTDAFGIAALLQMLDIRDAIENDRFLDVAPEFNNPAPQSSTMGKAISSSPMATHDQVNYDLRFADRERIDRSIRASDMICGLESNPPSLNSIKWAEPDANTFVVRGPSYLANRKKINAGTSIGRLVAVDLVNVDGPIYSGMSTHPTERIQLALQKEHQLQKAGIASDMPPFVFVVNIILPGPPFYHAVFYYAVDDMSTIDGSDGTGASLLCKEFLFGDSDKFRDKTFKLIPQIVEGNFMVRKAVGSTPAIMGTKLSQYYARSDRFLEVILDCGSSQVATGVIRLSLGYAKTLMIDMGFLLEADEEEFLPERIFGCVRMKFPEFGPEFVRKVEDPSKLL